MNDQPTEGRFNITDAVEALKNDDYDQMCKETHQWKEDCNISHQATEHYLLEKLEHDSHFRGRQKSQLIQDVQRYVQGFFNKMPNLSQRIVLTSLGMDSLYGQFVEELELKS